MCKYHNIIDKLLYGLGFICAIPIGLVMMALKKLVVLLTTL